MKKTLQILVLLYSLAFSATASLEFTSFTGNGDGTGTLVISMSNDVPVGGFEIVLDSSFDDFLITGASGGSAEDTGFFVSNGSTKILGFSFTGQTIPSSTDNDSPLFTELILVTIAGIDVSTSGNIRFNDNEGTGFAITDATGATNIADGDYTPLCLDSGITSDCPEVILGCTDSTACNYDSSATESDDSCVYSSSTVCYLDQNSDGYYEDSCGVEDGDECGVCSCSGLINDQIGWKDDAENGEDPGDLVCGDDSAENTGLYNDAYLEWWGDFCNSFSSNIDCSSSLCEWVDSECIYNPDSQTECVGDSCCEYGVSIAINISNVTVTSEPTSDAAGEAEIELSAIVNNGDFKQCNLYFDTESDVTVSSVTVDDASYINDIEGNADVNIYLRPSIYGGDEVVFENGEHLLAVVTVSFSNPMALSFKETQTYTNFLEDYGVGTSHSYSDGFDADADGVADNESFVALGSYCSVGCYSSGICNADGVFDCNGDCDGSASEDDCGNCYGGDSGFDESDFFASGCNSCDCASIDNSLIPEKFKISSAYPNPFNPQINIDYHVDKSSQVKIQIHNILGQAVEILADTYHIAGYYTISWDASAFPTGVYLLSVSNGAESLKHKILYLK